MYQLLDQSEPLIATHVEQTHDHLRKSKFKKI